MAEYRYHLAQWHERDKSQRCPGCGKSRGCFKEYLDENGTAVDPVNHTVGKCDHTSSCGYHLTPAEFFKMNPQQRVEWKPTAPAKPKKRIEIDIKFANQCRKRYEINKFVTWARSLTWTEEQAARLEVALDFYNVGTSKDGGTIWWQIDENMIVRTGKKMRYSSDGHRMKDAEGNSIGMNWVHTMMRLADDEHELVQCLFGEHLLPYFPDADVCIVESEKTAILMSAFDSQAFKKHIWMATGGKYNLQETKLYPLRHRKVLLYPDRDAVEEWKQKMKDVSYDNMRVFDGWIKQMWKPEDGEKADIGDTVLRLIRPKDEHLESNEAFRLLKEKMDLELIQTLRYDSRT